MDRTANRLIDEKSPYLLQHAHNPVDWQPWGDEAFNQAALEDKPVFLSIGYSTCHWCHVMEAESFEDEEVAELLNRNFVSIKVDREERPDIDAAYMAICQMMTGSGGWPLTLILTPEKKPFFAATYLPKKSALNRVGLVDLLPRINSVWSKRREEVYASANQVTNLLAKNSGGQPGKDLKPEVLDTAAQQLAARFDNKKGGFGPAPKFPTPHNLSFLLRHWLRSGEEKSLAMVEQTLKAMRQGGIFDQLGYGFHRYSTDSDWLLPHFEKMLYDQALICLAYLEAFQATGEGEYAQTARQIMEYVVRDLRAPGGGFYSAEDADSEGEEGRFYVWTKAEIETVLGDEEARIFGNVFNFEAEGNFKDEASGQQTGANIPYLNRPMAKAARELDLRTDQLSEPLTSAREKLLAARSKRVRPSLDDKILTDWNGLMIAALGRAARVLDEPEWAELARQAVDFILDEMRSSQGRLLHRWRDGEGAVDGFADDYAFLVWGLIELHQAGQDPEMLGLALSLTDDLVARFWDDRQGGLFLSAEDGEEVLTRRKEIYDGAQPSANSVAASNFIRLARLTGRLDLENRALELMRAFAGQVNEQPGAYTSLLSALDLALARGLEVVIVGRPDEAGTKAMLAEANRGFKPHASVLLRPEGQAGFEVAKLAEYTLEMTTREGRATAYVCTERACGRPTIDLEQMKTLMEG